MACNAVTGVFYSVVAESHVFATISTAPYLMGSTPMLLTLGNLCRWHRILAMVVVVALGFLALAAFSPLHKHDAAGRCSLNNFEHMAQGEAESTTPSLEICQIAWADHEAPAAIPPGISSSFTQLRGPPATV